MKNGKSDKIKIDKPSEKVFKDGGIYYQNW